jgi:glucokinase
MSGMPIQAVGIDIGGTHTKLAIVSADGGIQHMETLPTAARRDPRDYLERLVRSVDGLVRGVKVTGIGLAAAGFLSSDRRSVRYNPNTPALVGIDFVSLFDPLGLPVWLEQDLNVPAVAEYHFGRFRGAPRLMTASIGTGLGAGLMVAGQVLDFSGGTIGDTGHIILEPDGPACTAGCHGCGEALIATPGIERLAEKYNPDKSHRIQAHQVIAAAKDEEPWAVEIIEQVGGWLGQWLASVSPIFLPSHILLCGGVAEAGEPLRKRAEARFRELGGSEYTQCAIALSLFGARAGVIGAAAPFLKTSFSER